MIDFVVVEAKDRPERGRGAVVTPAGRLAGALLAGAGPASPESPAPLGPAGLGPQAIARRRTLVREAGS